jgi:nitroimidazol reductase NimA-like FMN-containing flavoprotein (pyridoxamine 5'-phosphate oxidase superfamily)
LRLQKVSVSVSLHPGVPSSDRRQQMSEDHATDRHGLEVLGLDECLRLLATRPFGRLAYLDAGAPSIVPVNHLVDGATVALRSLDGGKLGAAIFERPVAFEVDDLKVTERSGWSVVVHGRAEVVSDEDAAGYEAWLDSWAVGDGARTTWIRIVADEVTGRRFA